MKIEKMNGKDIIMAMRGIPERCDFCGEKKPIEELEPEEAGCWVCWECMERWEKNEISNGSN